MKNDNSSSTRKQWSSAIRVGTVAFAVLAAGTLFAFILFRLSDIGNVISGILSILQPVIYGLVIAYLLNPIMVACQKRLTPFFRKRLKNQKRAVGLSKGLSILAAILTGLCVLVVLCLLVLPQLSNSILGMINDVPAYLDNFVKWFGQILDSDEAWAVTLNEWVQEAMQNLEDWLKTSLLGYATDMLTYVTSGIISAAGVIVDLFIGMVVAVYTLIEKKTLIGQIKKVLYAFLKPRHANGVIDTLRHSHTIFGGFLYGKIIDSLLVGIITFVGMLIMGMPYPLLIGVLIGVTNIIPFFGPFIGAIPSAFLILLVNPIQGLYFIIFIVVLQQIDAHIISPKILGDATGLSEFWVTFSLLLFGGLFGVTGMIIGVPVFAVIYYVVAIRLRRRMKKRQMPTDSAAYVEAVRMDEDTGELVYAGEDKPTKPET